MSETAITEKEIIREMEFLMAIKNGDEKDRINKIRKLSFQLGEIVLNNIVLNQGGNPRGS